MNGALFGFDLFAIALSLWKMFVAEAFPMLGERWKRAILALLMSACVVVIGLQGQGVILPPESEPVVTLVLSAIMAFLVTMGYGPEAIGVINAAADLVRVSAIARFSEPGAMSEDGREFMVRRMIRYRLHK